MVRCIIISFCRIRIRMTYSIRRDIGSLGENVRTTGIDYADWITVVRV